MYRVVVGLSVLALVLSVGAAGCKKEKKSKKSDGNSIEDLLKKSEKSGGSSKLVKKAVKMGPKIIVTLNNEVADDANNKNRRLFSFKVLAELKHDDAMNGLFKGVNDEDPEIRRIAKEGLKSYTTPKSVRGLISKLKDKNFENRVPAMNLLGDLKNPIAIPILSEQLTYADPKIRLAAIQAMVKIKNRAAIDHFLRGASDPVKSIRTEAIKGLMLFADKSMVGKIKAIAIKENDVLLRRKLVGLYTKFEVGTATFDELLKKVYDKNAELVIRMAALKIINIKYKDLKTTGRMIRALKDDQKELGGKLATEIAAMLQARTAQKFGKNAEEWIKWYQTVTKKKEE